MIATYLAQIENVLQAFPDIRAYTLQKKIYNTRQGYIGGTITFGNGHRLDFIEVKDVDVAGKIKYRYQYMDASQEMIFRYDNAPHHRDVRTFPHHKHTMDGVQESTEPSLHDVLLEIASIERHSNR
jgi:hypothetical protein